MTTSRLPAVTPLGVAIATIATVAIGVGTASDRAWAQQAAPTAARGVFEHKVVEVDPASTGTTRRSASPASRAGSRATGPAKAARGIITRVEVDNRLGDVRIEGHDRRTIQVSAFKRAGDDATLDRLRVDLITDPKGPVRIATWIAVGENARPIPKGSIRIDLVIRAPRSAAVRGQVWNDRLEVQRMENGAELTANDGAIVVENVTGKVVTQSSAGKQNLSDIYGSVDAQAMAGDVELVIVHGKRLMARAHDGAIEGRQIRVQEMSLRTTTGDIRLEGFAVAGGRYSIASYRGNIDVKLGHAGPLAVLARSNRRITLPSRLTARADDSGALVGTLSAAIPTAKDALPAVIELRSRMGSLQFAVVE